MTTIAVHMKEGVVAYDSRTTQGSFIADDKSNKHFKRQGVHFFLGGDAGTEETVIEDYLSGNFGRVEEAQPNANGFVVDGEDVFEVGYSGKSGFWKYQINAPFSAAGSGFQYAIGAMMQGATAKEAVRIAAKCDTNTGGRIRTFKFRRDDETIHTTT